MSWLYSNVDELKSTIEWLEEDFSEGLEIDQEELEYLKNNLEYLQNGFR